MRTHRSLTRGIAYRFDIWASVSVSFQAGMGGMASSSQRLGHGEGKKGRIMTEYSAPYQRRRSPKIGSYIMYEILLLASSRIHRALLILLVASIYCNHHALIRNALRKRVRYVSWARNWINCCHITLMSSGLGLTLIGPWPWSRIRSSDPSMKSLAWPWMKRT